MRHWIGAMAIGAAGLVMAGSAQAQSWGVYVGNGAPAPYAAGWHDEGADRMMRFICSGQRAHGLENRLDHEVDEGDIDPGTANRIHAAIDGLEDRQRHECAEGDVRSVREIGWRYDRIGQWMESAAHGDDGPRWRPRW
ncbi:hypothetical protein FHW96_001396 [Novosphingobium sp. SG751A]|uniref:histidine kinase n=1 Tax=Novosphingobium sp. SG751A TaxID=2587000 RepID=UPI001552BE18|nr:histidine kinase [Novosphingobium sp. SG751A]NOW45241.1 hypothetical protein [Novosphingobium sp. SG751A]